MKSPTALALLSLAAIVASASAALAGARPAPLAEIRLPSAAQRGLALAQARCAGCHAVARNGISPNPESPPFDAVVNVPGLSRSTLERFLRDSHNYPEAMNFTIRRRDIRDLAAYMITLRNSDFHPPI